LVVVAEMLLYRNNFQRVAILTMFGYLSRVLVISWLCVDSYKLKA